MGLVADSKNLRPIPSNCDGEWEGLVYQLSMGSLIEIDVVRFF